MSNDRKEIDAILKQVNKEVKAAAKDTGEDAESIIVAGNDKISVESITTGSIAVDNAIGIGGYPKGRIIEVYGPEASGKTTFTLNTIAAAQNRGELCAFIDAEHALDPKLAEGCGVNWGDLLFVQPNYGEQALTFAEKLINTGKVSVVIIDSVAAMIPKQEYTGEIDGKEAPGAQARMMAKGLRKLTSAINKSKCIVIFINQIREKIGVMFGNPEQTPGGRALKFSCSIRIEVRRTESITSGKDNIVGNKLRVKIVKNKVAPPYKQALVDLIYGKGIDNTKDILEMAVQYGVVNKKGSGYFQYNDDVKANGMNNFMEKVAEFDVFDEIETKTREAMSSDIKPTVEIPDEEEDESGFDEE